MFTKPAPTLDERHGQATRKAEVAIDLFSRAAQNLEEAADYLDAICVESQELSDAHGQRAVAAAQEADSSRERAEKIRNLLGL